MGVIEPQIIQPRVFAVVCDEQGVKEVTLTLDNGTTCRIDVRQELIIPNDPKQVWIASQKAVGRFTFWQAQAARAVRRAKYFQFQRDKVRGHAHVQARLSLHGKCVSSGDDKLDPKQFGLVEAVVSQTDAVAKAERDLREAEYFAGTLQGLVQAFNHRLYMLRDRNKQNNQFDPKD
jgi:hypothetical protein